MEQWEQWVRTKQRTASSCRPSFLLVTRLALASTVALGCDGRAPTPPSSTGQAVEWAARRGSHELLGNVLERAGADNVERTLTQFVLASGFAAEHPAQASWLERVALAHALGDDLLTEARAKGPPDHQELERWTEAHWLSVDRPPAFRTVHAVVLVPSDASPQTERRAAELAGRLRTDVAGASSKTEFESRAARAPDGELVVKVEELEPVTADGRVVRLGSKPGSPTPTYDADFAAAAAALRVGETSPVVRSAFGYHVVRLLEVVPELRLGAEQRRELAAADVHDERAKRALDRLLSAGREGVAIERSAEEATGRVLID